MRIRLILGWLVVLSVVAAIGYAQAPPVRRLGLAEALDIAQRNNPDYLKALAARTPASRSLTNATAALITPTFGVSGGFAYRAAAAGQSFQGVQLGATPTVTQSSASLGLSYQLSGKTIADRGVAAAQLRAADQDIASASTVLDATLRQEYLNLLQLRAQADLAQHVVTKAQEALNLAQAKYNVGQNTMIDVRSAQVDKGNADVSLLQAQQNVQLEVLRLYQIMGVPAPERTEVVPTDSFPVVEPAYNQDSLLALALRENPVLLALRAREGATRWNVRAAYSQYLPSLTASASTGKQWYHFRAYQSQFGPRPDTSYSQSVPWALSLQVSLPIFDAFSRTSATAQASYQDENARQAIRAQQLLVRANVSAAYLALLTAYQTIGVQANNRAAADEALSLATERYRVGSGSIIELLNARVVAETAGTNYITAVYNYHKDIAALEQAVGRTLR